MTARGFKLDLTDAAHNGAFFVGIDDLDTLDGAAHERGLRVCRATLLGCHDKADLLARLAVALEFPPSFGGNWDALADCLRDLSWLPAAGYALLLEHADEPRVAARDDFEILLGIFADAAAGWTDQGVPFHVFMSLPDGTFKDSDAG